MPRKGTETPSPRIADRTAECYLEMRCPGRGRKLSAMELKRNKFQFGNEMPRKGTETATLTPLSLYADIIWK